ncbi:MAG: glycogen synthase GlgA [Candidatus Sedimenticola sp. (ex Thyasira tokunagai)]
MSDKIDILFVTSEAHPLIKTGGLADVSGALPAALNEQGHDVRLLIPGYPQVLAELELDDALKGGLLYTPGGAVRLLQGRMPGSGGLVYVIDSERLYQRDGGPYLDNEGREWRDNALRFATLSFVAAKLAKRVTPLGWRPDILHCNDWQSGLAPAYLNYSSIAHARTLMTVHNLAYQGVFDLDLVDQLWLPPEAKSMHDVEFHDQLCFLKAGLQFADQVNTVSPTYALEIQTRAFGCGLEGLLQHRSEDLHGVLNGIDNVDWDPAIDPHLKHNYSIDSMSGKGKNKRALQRELGLTEAPKSMLLGVISRLAEQKGLDLFADTVPQLMEEGFQVCLLGSGDAALESRFLEYAAVYPGRLAVHIGYNEGLAHRIEAGADAFVMPSRYEPCGLNQMYSMAYGTPPIVRRTGGLADSVIDTGAKGESVQEATGFIFDRADAGSLLHAIRRAGQFYGSPDKWSQIQHNGMARDCSWGASAGHYVELYQQLLR